MKAPNGETAYDVTAPMLEALHTLIDCEPNAARLDNIKTSVALLNRGWIMRSDAIGKLASDSTFYITKAGRKAYGIAKRMAGVA